MAEQSEHSTPDSKSPDPMIEEARRRGEAGITMPGSELYADELAGAAAESPEKLSVRRRVAEGLASILSGHRNSVRDN